MIGGSNIGKDQMQLNGTKWMLYVGIRAQQSDRILTYKIENVPKLVPIKNSKTLTSKCLSGFIVDLPGFEPRTTDPESVVLPLHHRSMSNLSVCGCKYNQNIFFDEGVTTKSFR